MRSAPVALPTFATAQFQRFFDCGRAVRCVLLLGGGRVMHLVVLHGYQGADRDPERLALTDQLLDAALDELGLWLVSSLVCWLVISTWSPPRFLAWQKESFGFWQGSWGYLQARFGIFLGVSS